MAEETGTEIVPAKKLDLAHIQMSPGGGVTIENVGQMVDMAKVMAQSEIAVRKHLRGNVGACLGVLMQALDWGMQPFMVASKSYSVNDQLAYEAQMIHAVILRRAPIRGRPKIEYRGEGGDRQVRVWANLEDDDDTVEYLSPKLKDIKPKNSPLWVNDPDQQLAYYGVRGLARRHFPDVIMGVYAPDEIQPTRSEYHNSDVLARPADNGPVIDGLTGEITEYQQEVAEHIHHGATKDPTFDHDPQPLQAQAPAAPPAKRVRRPKNTVQASPPPPPPSEPEDAQEAVEEAVHDNLMSHPAQQEHDPLDLIDVLQKELDPIKTWPDYKALLIKYQPAYLDLQETDPELAAKVDDLFKGKKESLAASPPPPPAVHEPLNAAQMPPAHEQQPVAETAPWPDATEKQIVVWDKSDPRIRKYANMLWKLSTQEAVETVWETQAKPDLADADPKARLVLRSVINLILARLG